MELSNVLRQRPPAPRNHLEPLKRFRLRVVYRQQKSKVFLHGLSTPRSGTQLGHLRYARPRSSPETH